MRALDERRAEKARLREEKTAKAKARFAQLEERTIQQTFWTLNDFQAIFLEGSLNIQDFPA